MLNARAHQFIMLEFEIGNVNNWPVAQVVPQTILEKNRKKELGWEGKMLKSKP